MQSSYLAKSKQVKHALTTSLIQFWHDLTWSEISGSLGDLGTFLPLTVGLVTKVNLDLSTTLLFTGLYNIITGFSFNIPMPVQPMKTIAAVALSESPLSIPEIMAAGVFVSACVLILGSTRMMGLFGSLIPMSVVKGMQLGLGLNLAQSGFKQVWFADGKGSPVRGWWGAEGLFLGLFSLVFTILTVYNTNSGGMHFGDIGALFRGRKEEREEEEEDKTVDGNDVDGVALDEQVSSNSITTTTANDGSSKKSTLLKPLLLKRVLQLGDAAERRCINDSDEDEKDTNTTDNNTDDGSRSPPSPSANHNHHPILPCALILVIIGVVATLIAYPDVLSELSMGPATPSIVVPTSAEWKTGILRAGLPQLPLTTFNSVISVCQLSKALFPDKPASPDGVAFSVGAMNVVGCWFGAMPSCHGAGGLAAQVRFGARSGAAPVFLGIVKIALALLFGSSLVALFDSFPSPILGAMLVAAGIELAAFAKGQKGQRGIAVMLLTATVALALSNVAAGVAAGLIAAYLLLLLDVIKTGVYYMIKKRREGKRERDNGGIVVVV
jgi:MFS superfamily sulfate permease-like transporter